MKNVKPLRAFASTTILAGLIIFQLLSLAIPSVLLGAEYITQQATEIAVINPSTGNSTFIFDTNTTSVGTRLNATLGVSGYGTPPVFAWQVRLDYSSTLLNITDAWNAVGDPIYIFTGRSSVNVPPAVGVGTILLGDSLLGGAGETPPPDPAKLATIEFEIIYAPISGKVLTDLSIDNEDTYLLDDTLAEIPTTKINGYYEYSWIPPAAPTQVSIIPPQLTVGQEGMPLPTPPFTITITIENVTDLFAWQVKLYYNATILNTRTDWIWLPPDHIFAGEQIIFPDPVIDSDEGGNYAQVGATLLGDTSVTGSGTLFQMNFTGGAEGISALQFSGTEDTYLLYPWDKDYDGFLDRIPYVAEDGSVTILGTVVEKEPSQISVNVEPSVVAAGADVTIYGTITPTPSQLVDVLIESKRFIIGGPWRTLNITQTDKNGNYTYTWKTTIEDLQGWDIEIFEIRASWLGDETYEGAISEVKNVTLIRPETSIAVEPQSSTVGEEDKPLPTQEFTLNITVVDVEDLFAWQIKLYYDPVILNFTSATYPLGHVFEGQDFIAIDPFIDTDPDGTYMMFGASLLGNQTGFSGNGTLCQLSFIGISSGSSMLSFSRPLGRDTVLFDSNLDYIPFEAVGGIVIVLGTPPKIPSTITLDVYPTKVEVGSTVTISGFIDPSRPGAEVTVYYRPPNGTWILLARVKTDSMSYYSFMWTPQKVGVFELKASWPGDENTYPAESDVKTLLVIEKVFRDLAVSLVAPEFVSFGSSAWLNATVYNLGSTAEMNVQLWLLINGTVADSAIIPALANGTSYTLTYSWNPSTEGTYNVTAYVPRVPGEPYYPFNNLATNFVTVSVREPRPLFQPSEGQWANYTYTFYDTYYDKNQTMMMSFNYSQYISPYLINVTFAMQDLTGQYFVSWTTVDILHRWAEAGIWAGMWYPGWIETSISLGSTIRLLDGAYTVTGSRVIKTAGLEIDCWELQLSSYYTNLTFWYDKATGLWVGMETTSGYDPGYRSYLILVATNIQVGQVLKIQTDKPMYLRNEIVTLTAAYRIGDMPVENATILIEVNYPNGTLWFLWTTTTDANGTAKAGFLIPDDAPYGVYTVYATAYKTGMANLTATSTFMVVHFEPELKLWFEAPSVALIGQNTTIILHIANVGNLTAYNVDATFTLPSNGDLQIFIVNTTYTGTIDAGAEVILTATVRASKPYRYVFLGEATYTKEDETPMPSELAQKTLIYAYHIDYPVDLLYITVSADAQAIVVNMTIINYGDWTVEVTLIASAQHTASNLMLRSTYRTVTINPRETITVSLTITVPTTAPSGEYLVQGILTTGLPHEGGFALAYKEQTIEV